MDMSEIDQPKQVIKLGEWDTVNDRWLWFNEKYILQKELCDKDKNIFIENVCFSLSKSDYCLVGLNRYDCEPPDCIPGYHTNYARLIKIEIMAVPVDK